MGSYILNFTVYTMAMCGLIFFALFVYKKFAAGSFGSKNSNFLNVEDTLSIGPRKTLMVVRAGSEKFLIVSDADKTNLISKLQADESVNFETHLQKTHTIPQKIAPQSVQNNYRKSQTNSAEFQTSNYQNTTSQAAREDFQYRQDEKTTFIGIDDLPDKKIKSKKNQSKDVLKSMVSRIKD